MPARVKVIAPTTRQNAHNYRDGPIKMSDYHNQYLTYPSMVKDDKTCIVMQEASDAHSKTADSDTVSTYQVSSVQLVTDKKLEAFNKA